MRSAAKAAGLRIDIAKRADHTGVLACTRADGSQTWQKQCQALRLSFIYPLGGLRSIPTATSAYQYPYRSPLLPSTV